MMELLALPIWVAWLVFVIAYTLYLWGRDANECEAAPEITRELDPATIAELLIACGLISDDPEPSR